MFSVSNWLKWIRWKFKIFTLGIAVFSIKALRKTTPQCICKHVICVSVVKLITLDTVLSTNVVFTTENNLLT